MTTEIINNGNRLIAEFMGWKLDERYGEGDVWSNNKNALRFCDLKFHKEWNWLMPVVEKIESGLDTGFNVVIKNERCRIYRHKGSAYENTITKLYGPPGLLNAVETVSKFESVYLAVVEFIAYFNNNFTEEEKKNLLK